jgi:hypothetical protein
LTQILLNAGGLKFVLQKRRQQFHDFTGLPLTADGWTDFTAMYQHPERYLDSRIVFVSNAGNDGTAVNYSAGDEELNGDPFSVTGGVMAYATLPAAYDQLRTGYPDILLLKRGDTFPNGLISPLGVTFNKSGRSSSERMIIAGYGASSSRPSLQPSTVHPLEVIGSVDVGNLVFSGLEFYAAHKDPESGTFQASSQGPNGIRWLRSGANVLFEDMHLKFSTFIIEGQSSLAIRRCVIQNSYALSGHAQGFYSDTCNGVLIEECTLDHNGYYDGLAVATAFNHNFYINNDTVNVTFRNNISARASSHGVQLRAGGTLDDNLLLSNPLGILVGGGNYPDPAGVTGTISRNVIIGAGDINGGARGNGLTVNNTSSLLIDRNIIAHQSSASDENNNSIAFGSTSVGSLGPSIGCNNVTASNNYIWLWKGAIELSAGTASETGFEEGKFHNIQLVNNRQYDTGTYYLVWFPSGTQSQITGSGNQYSTGRASHQWFVEHGQANHSLESFKTLIGDTTSIVWSEPGPAVPTIADYMASIGEAGGEAAFIAAACLKSRANWDTRFTAKAVRDYMWSVVPMA